MTLAVAKGDTRRGMSFPSAMINGLRTGLPTDAGALCHSPTVSVRLSTTSPARVTKLNVITVALASTTIAP